MRLADADGRNLSSLDRVLSAQRVESADGSTRRDLDQDFRYDLSVGGYVFQLDTTGLPADTYSLSFVVRDDPTVDSVSFRIR